MQKQMQTASAPASWQANNEAIAAAEKERPGFVFREEQMPSYRLPELLRTPDGKVITTSTEWETLARPAIIDTFTRLVFGKSPAVPSGVRFETVRENRHALDGRATHQRIRVVLPTPSEPFTFEFSVFIPNTRSKPAPAFLLLNNRGIEAADPDRHTKDDFWPVEMLIDRGYAAAVFQVGDVQADKPDGLTGGLIHTLPVDAEPGERWATLAAWAWAASRVLDGLQKMPELDPARIAVIGHSRGGKAALWAGATDPRFGLVISNDSGCCGAALNRRPFGETVARIENVFPHWFCGNFRAFADHIDDLPVDQHQLLAAIAPRPLYVASADQDLWADPHGEFLALAEASNVASLYGDRLIEKNEMPLLSQPLRRGLLAYHIRPGIHGLTLYDWQQYVSFADQVWR